MRMRLVYVFAANLLVATQVAISATSPDDLVLQAEAKRIETIAADFASYAGNF